MYTPERVIELIDNTSEEALSVFWMRFSTGSRDDFAKALRVLRGTRFIVPIVLRSSRFSDANALMADLSRTVSEHRDEFRTAQTEGCLGNVIVLLISKEEFRLPQVSSPVELPNWFPVNGGKTTYCRIADLGQSADVVLLNAPEARSEDIADSLFELERAMAARLMGGPRPAIEKLLKRAYKGGQLPGGVEECLIGHSKHLQSISSPRAYRPSVADARGLVAQLIQIILKTPSNELVVIAEELAEAMALTEGDEVRANLLAILFRPIGRHKTATKGAHTLLLTVFGAYQFLTGSAHAGDYPRLPASLVYSVSVDIRRTLRDGAELLRGAPR